jgi:hypothetical protein
MDGYQIFLLGLVCGFFPFRVPSSVVVPFSLLSFGKLRCWSILLIVFCGILGSFGLLQLSQPNQP